MLLRVRAQPHPSTPAGSSDPGMSDPSPSRPFLPWHNGKRPVLWSCWPRMTLDASPKPCPLLGTGRMFAPYVASGCWELQTRSRAFLLCNDSNLAHHPSTGVPGWKQALGTHGGACPPALCSGIPLERLGPRCQGPPHLSSHRRDSRLSPGWPDEGKGTARPEHIPQTGPPGEARAETARRLQSPLWVPRGRSGRGKSLWAPARNCKRAGAASLKTSEHRGGGSRAREPRGSANQRRAAGAGGACGRAVNGARRSRRRPRREPARGRAHFLHSAGRGRRRQRQRRRQRRSAQLPSESAAGPTLRGCEEPGRRAGHFPAR